MLNMAHDIVFVWYGSQLPWNMVDALLPLQHELFIVWVESWADIQAHIHKLQQRLLRERERESLEHKARASGI